MFKTSAISQAIIYLTIITQIIPTKPFQRQAGNQGAVSSAPPSPVYLPRWEEDQGPFGESEKFRKNLCHTHSLETQNSTGLTPPLGSRPHFQFGQFRSLAEIIVSLKVIKKNPNRCDFRSISNTDFVRGDSVHLLLFK